VPFVTSLGVGAHLEAWGIAPERIVELDWWESTTLPNADITIHAAPSQHFSGRGLQDRNATLWSSLVIESPKHRVFFSGDTGLTTEYVPFKVTGDAFANLLSGQIDFMSVDSTWAKSQSKVRILAVTATKRSANLPDVPTLAEAGVPGVDVSPWWGVVVPAGTPRPVIDKLAGWFNQITNSEETRQFLSRAALDPMPGSPEQMAALLKTEVERWGGFVKLAKIQPQ
jgi:tripartite-type tricarboxylate transporter receptor subunit TctC